MYMREVPQGKPAFARDFGQCMFISPSGYEMVWGGNGLSGKQSKKKKSVTTAKIQSSILHA